MVFLNKVRKKIDPSLEADLRWRSAGPEEKAGGGGWPEDPRQDKAGHMMYYTIHDI